MGFSIGIGNKIDSRGGVAAYSPLSLLPFFWYDYSLKSSLFQGATLNTPVVNDSDPIGSNADLSGNANTMIRMLSDDTKRPLYKTGIQNGLSIAQFDGINDTMQSTAVPSINTPFTIFWVGRFRISVIVSKRYFSNGTTGGMTIRGINQDRYVINAGTNLIETASPGTINTIFHQFSAVFNGASSLLRVDGNQLMIGNAGSNSFGGFTIASDGTGATDFGPIDLGECLCVPGAISGTTLTTEESRLKSKWGTP